MTDQEARIRTLERHVQLLRQRVDALEGRGNIHITDQEPPFPFPHVGGGSGPETPFFTPGSADVSPQRCEERHDVGYPCHRQKGHTDNHLHYYADPIGAGRAYLEWA